MPPQSDPGKVDFDASEPPKRFIRTLASDAEAIKRGTVPGFTSSETEQAPEATPIAPAVDELDITTASGNLSSLQTPPAPTQVPAAGVPREIIPEQPLSSPQERLINGSTIPPGGVLATMPSAEIPQAPATPPTPSPESLVNAPIHTYTSDFADQVTATNGSTASILAAEEDAKEVAGPSTSSPQLRHDLPLILGGALLLVLGGVGAYFAYEYQKTLPPPVVQQSVTAPIFVDERAELKGAGSALKDSILSEVQKTLPAGNVRFLYTAVATSTGSDVFHALQLGAPNALLRNIESEGSMAGVINAQGTEAPFFILRVDSYSDTFAALLTWEPRMLRDFNGLFITSTSTSAFKDEVIANHDARTLHDAGGQMVMVYGYWDPHTLIIAHDENAFVELLERLATSRTQK